ncbi:hypothetical protein BN946_scf184844.g93 [Trametes cinnabarina]|uniref:Uncharacterized protein n=1 Tax=Pycnoporus cinnabarinus TaxID=5643 RepID=A0A060SFQ3_PYCCI|nr:hypothetical protein BN946_scf184844.g93 [Trametes cinnabarina]
MTNYRDVASQILTIDHNTYVATYMQQELDNYDEHIKAKHELARDFQPTDASTPSSIGGGHFRLGAKESVQVTMASLVDTNANDSAYQNFWQRLGCFLTTEYKAHNLPLPDSGRIMLSAAMNISEYRLLRINYESLADWREETDLLRCSPNFFNQPRYDCVLLHATPSFFARLILVFTCKVGDRIEPLALVQPFDRLEASTEDLDLGFFRWYEVHY